MEADMSYAALIGIGLVALLFLGGLLLTLLLLAHRKSRPIGLALLGVGALGAVIVAGLAFLRWSSPDYSPAVSQQARPTDAATAGEAVTAPAPRSSGAGARLRETPAAGAEATTALPRSSSPPRQPGRVLKALGTALARGFQESKEDQEKSGGAPEPGEPAEPPPGWIDMEPRLVGDSYRMSVVIGPFQTRAECDAGLPNALNRALQDYTRQYLGPAAAEKVHFPPGVLEERLVQERWEETKVFETVGPMKQLHVLLEFDPEMKQDIAEQWDQARLKSRLWYTGAGLAALLGLLAVIYGGLVADRATGGRRRGRLGFAAIAAAALILVAAAVVIAAVG